MSPERGGRMIRAAIVLLTGGLSGTVGAPATRALPAAPPRASADSATIVTIERTWLQTSDTAVLGKILAPDFVHIVPGGHFLTRAEHLSWVATHPHRPDVRRRFAALAVRLYGRVAIANGVVAASDTTGHELGRTAFTDVFVRRDGRWQAVNAQEDLVRAAGAGERNGAGKQGGNGRNSARAVPA